MLPNAGGAPNAPTANFVVFYHNVLESAHLNFKAQNLEITGNLIMIFLTRTLTSQIFQALLCHLLGKIAHKCQPVLY